MAFNPATCPGMGDEATWGPCTGHPLDPRTPDDDELTEEEAFEMLLEQRLEDRMRELCAADAAAQFNFGYEPISGKTEAEIIHAVAQCHVYLRANFGVAEDVKQAQRAMLGAVILKIVERQIEVVTREELKQDGFPC